MLVALRKGLMNAAVLLVLAIRPIGEAQTNGGAIWYGEANHEQRGRVLRLLDRVGLSDQIDKHPDDRANYP